MKSPHGNIVIWRYRSFAKFADMVPRKRIPFPRADKFLDRSELNLPVYLFDKATESWVKKLENVDWLGFREEMKRKQASKYEATGLKDPDPQYKRDSAKEIEIELEDLVDEIMISPFATYGFRRTVLTFLYAHSKKLSACIKSSSVTE